MSNPVPEIYIGQTAENQDQRITQHKDTTMKLGAYMSQYCYEAKKWKNQHDR